MENLSKREVLRALIALGACAVTPALAQTSAPVAALADGEAIGEAYLAAHPNITIPQLRAALPSTLDAAALATLRQRAAQDFQRGAIFVYQGWRLSETEAQMFALLT